MFMIVPIWDKIVGKISTKLTLISGFTVIQSQVVNFYVSMLSESKLE